VAKNPGRRALLADAGLRVLASCGMRGLTHRAVDLEAGVPQGTASNYFPTRDALLTALGERIMERFAPDEAVLAELGRRPPSLDLLVDYLRYILHRTAGQPDLTRALFELRLEAVRRPGLARTLGRILRGGYHADVAFHEAAGLPGGAFEIALLHYAMDGLLLDLLTVSIDAGLTPDQAVTALAHRLVGGRDQGDGTVGRRVSARPAGVSGPGSRRTEGRHEPARGVRAEDE
jgi:AcrR family transcriptional regulator